jgi:membrane protease YdiL (CAAX protease family)
VLSEKRWKVEAIARLLIGVFICMCIGSLLGTAVYPGAGFQKHRTIFFVLAAVALLFLTAALIELGKAWAVENFRRRVTILFACFYPGLILLVWAQKLAGPMPTTYGVGQMFIGLASLQGAVGVLTWRMLRQQNLSWSDAFGLSQNWPRALLFGILVAGIFLPIGDIIQKLCGHLMSLPQSPFKPVEQQAVQTLRTASSVGARLIAGLFTIGLAPVGEELLFRGILYPTIKQAGFPKIALWATSLAFAAIHSNIEIFLPLFVLSLLLTFLYEKTNNLLAPITAHAVFNAVQLVYLYIRERQMSGMN